MKTTLLLTCLMAAGCSAPFPSHVTVYADPSVPLDSVTVALSVWEQVGVHSEIVTDKASALVTIEPDGATDCAPSGAPGGEYIWLGSEREGQILVRMACYRDGGPSTPTTPLAHEFGHYLDMQHVQDAALMNAYSDDTRPPVLTESDIAQFRALWGQP